MIKRLIFFTLALFPYWAIGQAYYKTIKQTQYQCVANPDPQPSQELVCCDNFLQKYDTKGHLIEEQRYDLSGNIDEKETFLFDQEGNEIENTLYLQDGSIDYKFINLYDKKNQLRERKMYDADNKVVSSERFSYDGFGNLLKMTETDEKGKVTKKIERKYNERGKIIQDDCRHFGQGAFGWREIFTYNERGKLITFHGYSDCVFDTDGNIVEREHSSAQSILKKYKLTYNNKQKLVEVSLFNEKETLVCKWLYGYQDEQCVSKSKIDAQGNTVQLWQYFKHPDSFGESVFDAKKRLQRSTRYDENGNIIELYSNNDGLIESKTYSYEFNSKKEWTAMIIFDNVSNTCIYTKRELIEWE